MATRIGKYKVSKRESAVSLIDGGVSSGTIAGSPRSSKRQIIQKPFYRIF